MGTTEEHIQDPGHANECIEEDRGSVLEGPNHKRRDSAEAGAGIGVLEVVKKRQEEWKRRLERGAVRDAPKEHFKELQREGDLEGDRD